jgi:hypothetical protein
MALENSEIALPVTAETMLDQRIVRLSFEVNGQIKTYENLFIAGVGVKYANPLQNEAEITIYNLDKATQDYIITETSPYNANYSPKSVILEAGRESYGTTIIYQGNIIYAGITQPPDIGVVLKCLTGNFLKTSIISRTQPGTSTLEQVSKAVAEDTNLLLTFQARDKQISNYAYAGSALQQIATLASLGQLNVFIDNDSLIVKDAFSVLGNNYRLVSAATGMIGIPEFTERGIRVKFFIDNKTVLGGGIQIQSELYPAANGFYVIYQLAFIITNRLTPFYYIADCARIFQPSEESTSG